MATSIHLHVRKNFSAVASMNVNSVPFSVLTITVDDGSVTLFSEPDNAIKLTQIARLLNEVFAKEGEQVE